MKSTIQEEVKVLDDLAALQVLGHPIRVQLLESLREPGSAAEVARRLDQKRQKVNYHLKELERVDLIRPVGERRTNNFVETLYQAAARAYIFSPSLAWSDTRRSKALADQHSLQTLVMLGEKLQRDAAALLNQAAFGGAQIASVSVEAEAGFASEEHRSAFLEDYLNMLTNLLSRYGAKNGDPYRLLLAAYPDQDSVGM